MADEPHSKPMSAHPIFVETRAARRSIRWRLFRKYLILILLPVTVALLASKAISIYFFYQEIRSGLASLQHEKALALASWIEQDIRQIEQQLTYVALPQLDASMGVRYSEFRNLLRQVPAVTNIAQLDSRGTEQIAVSRLGPDKFGSGKERSEELAFRYAKCEQPWFGPVLYFRKETEPYMTIAIRSCGDKGPVTVAEVNLTFLGEVVSRIKIGDKGNAYVVDGNGLLIAHNGLLIALPPGIILIRKTDMSHLPHVKAAIAGERSDELAIVSTELAGRQVLTSVVPIESLHWYAFVEQPVSEMYQKLTASILRTGLLLLTGFVISALGALALAQRTGAGEPWPLR